MELLFRESFLKDLRKLKDRSTKKRLLDIVDQLKEVQVLEEISGIKAMSDLPKYLRLRIGDYRLGLYREEGQALHLVRFLRHREIYSLSVTVRDTSCGLRPW